MRVCLSHEKEMAQIIILAAQISDDDARRNSGQTHQGSEAGCVVFAKANPSMKEKLFQIVLSVFAWRQGIAKTLRSEKLERAIHYGARAGVLRRPGLCQLAHSRTNRWRKLECFPPFAWRQIFSSSPERRNDFISARLSNGLNAPKVIATCKDRTRWDFERPIERKHPACAMRSERNPLANCIVGE
jgi:hypothetical protein